jgi:2'-5' RNA ligase
VHAFHVTLRFLGAVASEMVADVSGAVRDAVKRMPSFGVSPGGLGAFPRPTRATVLWCGVDDGAAALAECARRVEEALRALRFVPERRPFVPHVTLARLRAPQDLSAWLAAQGASATAPLFPAFPAVQVSLMESQLGPGGAVHSPVAVYPLG